MSIESTFEKAIHEGLPSNLWLTDKADTFTYGYDNSRKHAQPDAVALCETSVQVAHVVKTCYEHGIPLTARGRASGTAGGAIPIQGGVVLSLERMDSILHFDPQNRTMVVEPGVLNSTVQELAASEGFFWGPDPSSAAYCTIGGNLACNAAGPRSIKYGTTRDNVLGLKAVTGKGETIVAGVHTTKGVVGYDLTRLLIGSEGTLGIITEATLKLLPLNHSKRTLCALFDSIQSGVDAIVSVMNQPVIPCAVEIMDELSLSLIRNHQKQSVDERAKAMLILEVDGSEASIDDAAEQIKASLSNQGLIECTIATTPEQTAAIWATRKLLSPALRSLSEHKVNEDIVIPVSKMPVFFEKMGQLSEQYDIPIVNFGHGGNGNIHVNMLADLLDEQQGPVAHKVLNEIFDMVVELGGTLSGEHGVGLEKRDYVHKEMNPVEVELMKQIKAVFDPKGILNPDKLLPLDA